MYPTKQCQSINQSINPFGAGWIKEGKISHKKVTLSARVANRNETNESTTTTTVRTTRATTGRRSGDARVPLLVLFLSRVPDGTEPTPRATRREFGTD